MIRFIHCADLHFGKNISTHRHVPKHFHETLKTATYKSFERMVDIALEKEVDFLLISGDVFDSNERTLKGRWFLKKQAERLNDKRIPIYIIHGNHDPLEDELSLPSLADNIYVFPKEMEVMKHVSKEKDTVYIYGFSYPNKNYTENPVPLYVRKNDDEAFHIAMLHGQESSQQDHEPYAPFTLTELKEKDFHYWALGHIHKRQILSEQPMIVYPGNIQGANRKETGEKGAYYVEMTYGNTSLTFFDTSPVQWEKVTFSIDSLTSEGELLEKIEEDLFRLRDDKFLLLDIQIAGSGPLHEKLYKLEDQEEFFDVLQQSIRLNHVHIDRLVFRTSPEIDREKLINQDNILGDIVRISQSMKESDQGKQYLEAIFKHGQLRKYLTSFTDEELLEIIDEAEKQVLTPLISEVNENENY